MVWELVILTSDARVCSISLVSSCIAARMFVTLFAKLWTSSMIWFHLYAYESVLFITCETDLFTGGCRGLESRLKG